MKKNIFFTNRNQIGLKNQQINKTLMADGGLSSKDLYYHVLEVDGNNYYIGYQGYYRTKSAAEELIKKLNRLMPDSYFNIYIDDTPNEPPRIAQEYYAKGGKPPEKPKLIDVYNELTREIPELELHEDEEVVAANNGNSFTAVVRYWGDWEHDYDDYDREEEDFEDDDFEILSKESRKKMNEIINKIALKFPDFTIDWNTGEKNWIDIFVSRKSIIMELKKQKLAVPETPIAKKSIKPIKIKPIAKKQKNKNLESLKFLNNVFMAPAIYDFENFEEQLNTRSVVQQNEAEISLIQETENFNPELFVNSYFTRASNIPKAPIKVGYLTEAYNKIVTSAPFIDWFGDWRDDDVYSSKIILDGNQESEYNKYPLIVYHGTWNRFTFSRFNFNKFPLIYFAENKSYAEWFSNLGTGIIYECFLNIRRLCDLSALDIFPITWAQLKKHLIDNYGIELPGTKSPDFSESHQKPVWAWLRNDGPHYTIINAIALNKFDGICQVENNHQDKDEEGNPNTTKAFMIFDSAQAKITQFVSSKENYFSDFSKILFLKNGGQLNK